MREADRFLSIVQNHAVANVFNRPTVEINGVPYLICTIQDLAKGIELYFSDEARKTIFSKIPTNKIKFFEEVILPLSERWPGGVDTTAMQKKYKEVFDEAISINTINYHYLQPLENMDLISRDDDPKDKRRKLTVPLREKVFTGEAQIRTLFEKGDIFTKEKLKEAFSKLKQLIVRDNPSDIVKIKDYDGTIIENIDILYETYFSKNSLTAGGLSNNYLSGKREEPKAEKEEENVPVSKKGTIPPIEERQQIAKIKSLIRLDTPDFGECAFCKEAGIEALTVLKWQITTQDDLVGCLCQEHGEALEKAMAGQRRRLSFEEISSGPTQLTGELFHKGICETCGEEKTIEFNFTDYNGERHEMCADCAWAFLAWMERRRENG